MRAILIFLIVSVSLIASAQDTLITTPDIGHIPEYPGGEVAMQKFIKKNVVYPDLERENNIQGLVLVSFTVDEEGNLSDIHIKRGVSKGINMEALRVFRLFPKFKPGIQKGQAVKADVVQGINFKLQSDGYNGLTNSHNVIIDRKSKSEADYINRQIPLGDIYDKVLDVCKRDYTEIESIKAGVLTLDLSQHQKEQLKAQNKIHHANLKVAMGDDLYGKYEAARVAKGEIDND
jgi:TonB family protein